MKKELVDTTTGEELTLGEAIARTEGSHRDSMRRDRPYDGQRHTDHGMRGQTEIKGITFRDLRDCFIRAFHLANPDQSSAACARYEEACKGPDAIGLAVGLEHVDLDHIDLMSVAQNMSCEVERLMGIWPNVPKLDVAEHSKY